MIKVGVIGLGAMGKNHVRVYSELADVELVGIADPNDELAQNLAKKYHTAPFRDYKELLLQNLDAVSIAVPTSLHKEIALDSARAGVHILVEKPIADTIAAAKEIIKYADNSGIKLMVGYIERFNPVISILKEKIAETEVNLIEITRIGPLPPRIKDVGVVVDLASHDIDLISYLTDSEFKTIYSLTSSNLSKHEDVAILLFGMANGTLARVTVDWLTPFKVREINVATEKKFIKASLIDQKLFEYDKYERDGSYRVKEIHIPFSEPLKIELAAFIDSIRNDTQPPISGKDGLKALEVAFSCLESQTRE